MALGSRDLKNNNFWVVNFYYSLKTYLGKNWEIKIIFLHVRCVFHQKFVTFVKIKKIGGGGKKKKKVVAQTIIAFCAGLIGKLGLPLKSICYLSWLLFEGELLMFDSDSFFFGLNLLLL